MTRYRFGKTTSDTTVRRVGSLLGVVPATLTFYDAEAGGTQYVDLAADEAGTSPLIQVTSDKFGAWEVYGPDGVTAMWLDDGNPETPRVLVVAPEAAAEAATRAETAAASVARGEPNGVAPLDAAALLPEANVPSRLTAVSLGGTYAAKPRSGTKAVGQDELILNVLDFGATGDGVTNDAGAINAAISAASLAAGSTPAVVWLPWTDTGYASSALVFKSNVTIRGENRVTLKKAGAASAQWLNVAAVSNVLIEGLTIDPAGLVTSATMRAATGTSLLTVRDCTFLTSAPLGISVNAFDTQAGSSDLVIEDCWFKDLADNIRINQGPARVTIRRNLFSGWAERCVYVLGSSTAAVADLAIEDNICRDHNTAGTVRQPITIQGNDAALHTRVKVNHNTVIGNATSHGAGTGTADQISLHRCQDFEVIGNISVDGGEVGITVAQQSRRGVIANNVITGSDGAGLAIGSSSSTAADDITINGNTIMDNGHNRAADTAASGLVGIYFYNAHNIAVTGNRVGDDQAVATQPNAFYLNGCSGLRFAGNNTAGNITGTYDLGAGNSDVTEASMTAVV